MSDNNHGSGKPDSGGLFERLRNLFGVPQTSVREDIEEALEEATETELSAHERSMLRSVLGLKELRVRDIMVPRTDITAVEKSESLGHVLKLFRTAGHSRLPVYDDSLDAPQGMVHIRDFLELLARLSISPDAASGNGVSLRTDPPADELDKFGEIDLSGPLPLGDVLRPVLFVPPSMPVLDLLVRMQSERTHMALVIDEYGGTDGLVSIEDVVEVIVGDIEDEHDIDETPRIETTPAGDFIIDARAPLDQAIAVTGVDFGMLVETEDIDTVAGFIAILAGRIPEEGETIKLSGAWEFEILSADRRLIKLVKLRRPAPPGGVGVSPSI